MASQVIVEVTAARFAPVVVEAEEVHAVQDN